VARREFNVVKSSIAKTTSVRDRVQSAITYLSQEAPCRPLRVARVCSVAGVNRGNLYARHPDLVQLILARQPRTPVGSSVPATSPTKAELQERVRQLSLENKALLYLLLEKRLSEGLAPDEHA
jgi:hypothetical protein